VQNVDEIYNFLARLFYYLYVPLNVLVQQSVMTG